MVGGACAFAYDDICLACLLPGWLAERLARNSIHVSTQVATILLNGDEPFVIAVPCVCFLSISLLFANAVQSGFTKWPLLGWWLVVFAKAS